MSVNRPDFGIGEHENEAWRGTIAEGRAQTGTVATAHGKDIRIRTKEWQYGEHRYEPLKVSYSQMCVAWLLRHYSQPDGWTVGERN
jgi:hypothetical protein